MAQEKRDGRFVPSRGLRKAEKRDTEETGPALEDKENITGLALEEDKENRSGLVLEDKMNRIELALEEDKESKAGPVLDEDKENRSGLLLPAAKPRRSQSDPLTRLKARPIHRESQEQEAAGREEAMFLPPDSSLLLGLASLSLAPPCLRAVVEEQGFVSLSLSHGVTVDLSPDLTVRVRNPGQQSAVTLAPSTCQLAVVHPTGRILQYGPRIEVQVEDRSCVKNAKVFPRGISFTANTFALVYLLDEAGARTTSDTFHDLYASQPEDSLFSGGLELVAREELVRRSVGLLKDIVYWQEEGRHCWEVAGCRVQQEEDGLVTVEGWGGGFLVRLSPATGRLRLETPFLRATASMGEEGHVFLRSGDRRLHYSSSSTVLTVRQAQHSAGFDAEGELRIY